MQKSTLFNALPDISFVDTDPDNITREIISRYENISGRTLSQSDPVRLFLLSVAYVIAHQRTLIDIAAKNNLLAYAEGDYLDHIGALLGVTRMDGEDDESLRERIGIAPESFSVAGPAKAYEFHAKKADPDIQDVKILTPPDTEPGHVDIYVLMKNGSLPNNTVLDKVKAICDSDTVRPDTDYVQVKAPSTVDYSVDITYWIDTRDSAMSGNIQTAVDSAVYDWVEWTRSEIGRDINPSALVHRVIQAGAKRCVVTSPAFTQLNNSQLATCSHIAIAFSGLEAS